MFSMKVFTSFILLSTLCLAKDAVKNSKERAMNLNNGVTSSTQRTINKNIMGGYPVASIAQFPYQAQVQLYYGGRWSLRCGGAVISQRYILTVAQCVYGVSASDIRVIVGTTINYDYYQNSTVWFGNAYYASRLIPHQNYNPFTVVNDIGLINTRNQILYSMNVYPANFLMPVTIPPGQAVTVTGWGYLSTYSTVLPMDLQYLNTFVTNYCVKNTADNLCTMDWSGNLVSGICKGDGGGPLVLTGTQTVVGLVSLIRVSNIWQNCAQGNDNIYTNISTYLPWIVQNAV